MLSKILPEREKIQKGKKTLFILFRVLRHLQTFLKLFKGPTDDNRWLQSSVCIGDCNQRSNESSS